MLKLKQGTDILAAVGGVATMDEAHAVFEAKCDQETRGKLARIANEEALIKVANAIAMTDPQDVFVNTGSPEDVLRVRIKSLAKREEVPVNMYD
ncbi:MAG: phosphoenolpyruvate carboxykinase, partial [Anaerolineae bacterium]